jgi:hypothetical protein
MYSVGYTITQGWQLRYAYGIFGSFTGVRLSVGRPNSIGRVGPDFPGNRTTEGKILGIGNIKNHH